jgi:ActR/RegA family two-component response regulator
MKYATITNDDGVDYRKISREMSKRGWKMNHSSVRNYVLRIMQKFAAEYSMCIDNKIKKDNTLDIAKNPEFQAMVSDLIQKALLEMKNEDNN